MARARLIDVVPSEYRQRILEIHIKGKVVTSQVAIYNQQGIALASSIACTSYGENGAKTVGNSEKIFELGGDHKVVVLHHGISRINDLVHQFHVNEWRLSLFAPLPTLEAYVESYRHWSANGPRFHSDESVRTDIAGVIRDYLQIVRSEISEAFDAREDKPGEEEGEDFYLAYVAAVNEVLAEAALARLMRNELFEGMTETKARALIKSNAVNIDAIIDDVFEGFVSSANFNRTLRAMATQIVARQWTARDSTLVFIGFGTEDSFAATITLVCRGLIDGALLANQSGTSRIAPRLLDWEISTFGQGQAIEIFFNDLSFLLLNEITHGTSEAVWNICGDGADISLVNEQFGEVLRRFDLLSWKRLVHPIGGQLAILAPNAIAQFCETLVMHRVSASQAKDGPASVGGFIEVVTIDRVDGVRWVKRLPRA